MSETKLGKSRVIGISEGKRGDNSSGDDFGVSSRVGSALV